MTLKAFTSVLALVCVLGCSSSAIENKDSSDAIPVAINKLDYNQVLIQIGGKRLQTAVQIPNSQGALGRNKSAYFHVRFQIAMSTISDFAVTEKRLDALEGFFDTLDYAFNRQLPQGDFELVVPNDILSLPDYAPPSEGDLASGTSFFASSLGISLLTLANSDWFVASNETLQYRNELQEFNTKVGLLLDYLMTQETILMVYDQFAPNRLLYDAMAFYALGNYLDRQDAMDVGVKFLETALALRATEGYFLENNGWDSSYNGVALQLGFELLGLMESENTEALEKALIDAITWQISRIQDNGEITTEGNTRVFPGGESFLGREKGVDYPKTVRSLLYYSAFTQNDMFTTLADKVLEFYM